MKARPLQLRKRLGATLRKLRMREGWTQEELAALLRESGYRRCSRALFSQIESGAAATRGHEIYYFRQVFGEPFEQDFWKPFYNCKRGESPKGGDL